MNLAPEKTHTADEVANDATKRGFFTPYRHAANVAPLAHYPEIEAMMVAAAPVMREVLEHIEAARCDLARFGGEPPAPRFEQDWFPRLDAAAAYAMVRHLKPRRIVEIGSGHSTRIMVRAISDGGFPCTFTAIDPQPRADIASLPVARIAALFAPEHFAHIDALEAGDILFVDSSHILWPGTDVDLVLSRVLPRLAQGVVIHIHDILLPDAYPPQWAWRGYTEQQGVAALLTGGGFDILFASHFALTRLDALGAAPFLASVPFRDGALETSLWLRKGGAGVWR